MSAMGKSERSKHLPKYLLILFYLFLFVGDVSSYSRQGSWTQNHARAVLRKKMAVHARSLQNNPLKEHNNAAFILKS